MEITLNSLFFNLNDVKFSKFEEGVLWDRILTENIASRFSLDLIRIPPKTETASHIHDNREELYVVIAGEAEVWVSKKKYLLKRENLLFIPKKSLHTIINKMDTNFEFLVFTSPPYTKNDDCKTESVVIK